ncbi:MAG: SHOCT domain-containing protein [Terrimesophilobacter sp.]
MMGGLSGGLGFMWLSALLALAGITLLVILLVRLLGGGLNRRSTGDSMRGEAVPDDGPLGRSQARQILDERFARGELTAEDYRKRLRALGERE